MQRRAFLKSGSVWTLPVLLGGMKVGVLNQTALDELISADDDRIFVLIQQNGGNDGLNMVIPIDQYDNLSTARPNILIPENHVLKINDSTGFHPVMTGAQELFKEGALSIFQNVGYANQNRSHFRSTDIWNAGSSAGDVLATGWVGRYLDTEHSGYPEGFPNQDNPHPIAITLGPSVSETCQGIAANFSLAINDPTELIKIPGGDHGTLPDLPYGYELKFLRQIIEQNNVYADILKDAADAGKNMSDLYPEGNSRDLSKQLQIVAQLISGGLQTKIYIVNINGWDTHANQVSEGNSEEGIHADLLAELSQSIYAFMDDLKKQGLDHRVVGATRSEFGRQIGSNGSFGTDHGDAAPLLVFGSCVNGTVVGDNPQIPFTLSQQEGVTAQIDFKNIFGSILMDWFGASDALVATLFSGSFEYLPIITACQATPTREVLPAPVQEIKAYPNPFYQNLTVQFHTHGGPIRITLLNDQGQLVHVLTDQAYPAGTHEVPAFIPNLTAGHYFYRLENGQFQTSRGLVRF